MNRDRSEIRAFAEKLTTQRRSLGTTGFIDLRHTKIPSFTQLGSQPKLRKLNVSHSDITSFETLPSQPVMTQLIANNTKINSYIGLSRQPRLSNLSLKNTPLSNRPHFRLEALIVVGQHLMTLNGEQITNEERAIASRYPVVAQNLIEAGWKLVHPCPKIDTFRNLAISYNLKFKGVDKNFTNENADKYLRPPPQIPIITDMHETVVGVHNNRQQKKEEQEQQLAQDKELMDAIATELKRIGIFIGKDLHMEENIITAVQGLCDIVHTLEPCGDVLLRMTEADNHEEDDSDDAKSPIHSITSSQRSQNESIHSLNETNDEQQNEKQEEVKGNEKAPSDRESQPRSTTQSVNGDQPNQETQNQSAKGSEKGQSVNGDQVVEDENNDEAEEEHTEIEPDLDNEHDSEPVKENEETPVSEEKTEN